MKLHAIQQKTMYLSINIMFNTHLFLCVTGNYEATLWNNPKPIRKLNTNQFSIEQI